MPDSVFNALVLTAIGNARSCKADSGNTVSRCADSTKAGSSHGPAGSGKADSGVTHSGSGNATRGNVGRGKAVSGRAVRDVLTEPRLAPPARAILAVAMLPLATLAVVSDGEQSSPGDDELASLGIAGSAALGGADFAGSGRS
ncbi:UNVERIFIED_CONTAM: hypothetical protein FKN15_016321 [Acipenser sinensis]